MHLTPRPDISKDFSDLTVWAVEQLDSRKMMRRSTVLPCGKHHSARSFDVRHRSSSHFLLGSGAESGARLTSVAVLYLGRLACWSRAVRVVADVVCLALAFLRQPVFVSSRPEIVVQRYFTAVCIHHGQYISA